jgi:hypothetical protein
MKTFLESGREEVSNEEEAEEEGKAEKRPDLRKRGKGGPQEKRMQFNIPEEVHGEHEIDRDGEGPQRDGDWLRRSMRARRAPDRYSPEAGLAVAVLLLGFFGSIRGSGPVRESNISPLCGMELSLSHKGTSTSVTRNGS